MVKNPGHVCSVVSDFLPRNPICFVYRYQGLNVPFVGHPWGFLEESVRLVM